MTYSTTEVDPLLLTEELFNERAAVRLPVFRVTDRSVMIDRIKAIHLKSKISLLSSPVMELSARHPYDAAGFMDFYKPGRWDCQSNLVFMNPIVQTGPSPGQWDGTVGYFRFKAPTAGTYVIVVNFSGYQTTMNAFGPWGTQSAFTAETSDTGVITASWTGAVGQQVFFTISCKGPYLGYLHSVQVFAA